MERFGPEIEADLQETYGVDLGELFDSKRWPKLLRLIDRLPPHSRYISAIRNDEEEAKKIIDHPDFNKPGEDTGPSLEGYTQLNYQVADLIDAVRVLQATLVGVNGGKAKNPKPVKRPMTAIDKVKAQRAKEGAIKTMDLFSPKTE
ncbi:hypothetical protein [Glutamicibacter sp. TV12E]|uniref:hypothetical protein n=1 Tax=Glutamicibacter sp. TV12E TaxID=3446362 RepID=UPI0040341DAD